MAKKVTKKGKKAVITTQRASGWTTRKTKKLQFDVFDVVADTYSELISAIDEIPDEDLFWWSGDYEQLGIEGMPNKRKGKWRAKLRTEGS